MASIFNFRPIRDSELKTAPAPILPAVLPQRRKLHGRIAAPRGRMLDRLLSPTDCQTGAPRSYVVKHLIAPGNVCCLLGQPGTGKSILGPYLAYAVAQGRPVFGLRTNQGRVLYAAAEDVAGMRQRVHALKLRHGDATDFALADCGNLLSQPEADSLREAVGTWKPTLVVIDTLAAAWAGLEENSPEGMGQVVALSLELASMGCAVLLSHHPAKQGDGTPRGHGSLNGALDMVLSLTARDDAGVIRCALPKNRNGSPDLNVAFRFDVVALGVDEDGDEITAPCAVEVGGNARSPATSSRLPRSEAAALKVLGEMLGRVGTEQADGRVAVPERDWRQECDNRRICTSENAKSRGDVFRRSFAALIDKGRIEAGDEMVWLPIHPAAELIATLATKATKATVARLSLPA